MHVGIPRKVFWWYSKPFRQRKINVLTELKLCQLKSISSVDFDMDCKSNWRNEWKFGNYLVVQSVCVKWTMRFCVILCENHVLCHSLNSSEVNPVTLRISLLGRKMSCHASISHAPLILCRQHVSVLLAPVSGESASDSFWPPCSRAWSHTRDQGDLLEVLVVTDSKLKAAVTFSRVSREVRVSETKLPKNTEMFQAYLISKLSIWKYLSSMFYA